MSFNEIKTNEKGSIFLVTKDKVKLTTLVHTSTIIPGRCSVCRGGRRAGVDTCYAIGQSGHSTVTYKTGTTASPVAFLTREPGHSGILKQEICAYSSLFHLVIQLSEGKTKDQVGLKIDLKSCSESKGKYKAFPSKIKSVFIKLKLLDKDGQVAESKYLTTVNRHPTSWKELNIVNDHFCTVALIRKCIQTSAWTIVPDFIIHDSDKTVDVKPVPFEFVDIQLEIKLELDNHAKFWLSGTNSKCILKAEDTHHEREFFTIHQDQEARSSCRSPSPPLQIQSTSSSSATTTNDEQPPRAKKSRRISTPTTTTTSFVSKYSEIITISLGGSSDKQFFVPKFLLVEHSPVFKAMFEAHMQERRTGEIVLPSEFSPEAVEWFLDLLFDREDPTQFAQNPIRLLDILGLTHLYQMTKMMDKVLGLIICIPQKALSVQLAVSIFGAGEKYDIPDLKFRAMQWITLNKEIVLSDKGKEELDKVATGTPRIFSAFMEWLL